MFVKSNIHGGVMAVFAIFANVKIYGEISSDAGKKKLLVAVSIGN